MKFKRLSSISVLTASVLLISEFAEPTLVLVGFVDECRQDVDELVHVLRSVPVTDVADAAYAELLSDVFL